MSQVQKLFNLELEPAGVVSAESPIRFVASSATPDRVGDRVFPKGMDLANFEKNPIVLFNHEHESPIGTARVWVEGEKLLMEPVFSDASETARETAALVRQGVLKAVSIGFMPLEVEPNDSGGFDITKSELLEVSIVSVPMNPEAIRVKSMSDFSEQLKALDAKLDMVLAKLETKAQPPSPQEPVDEVKAFFAALTTQHKEQ